MSKRRRKFGFADEKTRRDCIRAALYEVRVKNGFCIPPDDGDRISRMTDIDADGFALAVLKAEGLDEISGNNFRKPLAEVFAKYVWPFDHPGPER